jgi:hypothetical protein
LPSSQDDLKKANQDPLKVTFELIPDLHLCQAELDLLDSTKTRTPQDPLAASERAFATIKRMLPANTFPHTRRYALGLIKDGLA